MQKNVAQDDGEQDVRAEAKANGYTLRYPWILGNGSPVVASFSEQRDGYTVTVKAEADPEPMYEDDDQMMVSVEVTRGGRTFASPAYGAGGFDRSFSRPWALDAMRFLEQEAEHVVDDAIDEAMRTARKRAGEELASFGVSPRTVGLLDTIHGQVECVQNSLVELLQRPPHPTGDYLVTISADRLKSIINLLELARRHAQEARGDIAVDIRTLGVSESKATGIH